MMNSCIYFGGTTHQRLRPFRHGFRYRLFMLFIDLDELEQLQAQTKILSYNGFNIFGIYDRDHARRDGSSMKSWVLEHAARRGVDLTGGKVFMLAFPRLFGYVFNPLTMYFCRNAAGQLAAVLYEVKNTFGDQHGYFMPVTTEGEVVSQHAHLKEFHVSPFLDIAGKYDFTLKDPGEKLALLIRHADDAGDLLLATWNGRRAELNFWNLMRALVLFPFQAFYVVFAIHWQALILWIKGAKYHPHPAPPTDEVS